MKRYAFCAVGDYKGAQREAVGECEARTLERAFDAALKLLPAGFVPSGIGIGDVRLGNEVKLSPAGQK